MNTQPLVSIIIPTYNRAHLITETLDSIIVQTYRNWECIIVDDGSIDNTAEVVQAYATKDPRFQYHQRPNIHKPGGNGARNYGLKLSKGEYINWFDSDDLISPNKLEYQVSALREHNPDVIICEWLFFVSKDDVNYSKSYSYKDFKGGFELLNYLGSNSTYIPIHAYLIKSEIINLSGMWNESLKINQDGEFMVRVLLRTTTVKFVANAYALYRKSISNNTSSYKKEKLNDLIKSWKLISKHCRPFINKKKNIYVFNAKKRIFRYLKDEYPFFIIKNFFFFKEVIYKLVIQKIKIYQGYGSQLFKRKNNEY